MEPPSSPRHAFYPVVVFFWLLNRGMSTTTSHPARSCHPDATPACRSPKCPPSCRLLLHSPAQFLAVYGRMIKRYCSDLLETPPSEWLLDKGDTCCALELVLQLKLDPRFSGRVTGVLPPVEHPSSLYSSIPSSPHCTGPRRDVHSGMNL